MIFEDDLKDRRDMIALFVFIVKLANFKDNFLLWFLKNNKGAIKIRDTRENRFDISLMQTELKYFESVKKLIQMKLNLIP